MGGKERLKNGPAHLPDAQASGESRPLVVAEAGVGHPQEPAGGSRHGFDRLDGYQGAADRRQFGPAQQFGDRREVCGVDLLDQLPARRAGEPAFHLGQVGRRGQQVPEGRQLALAHQRVCLGEAPWGQLPHAQGKLPVGPQAAGQLVGRLPHRVAEQTLARQDGGHLRAGGVGEPERGGHLIAQ